MANTSAKLLYHAWFPGANAKKARLAAGKGLPSLFQTFVRHWNRRAQFLGEERNFKFFEQPAKGIEPRVVPAPGTQGVLALPVALPQRRNRLRLLGVACRILRVLGQAAVECLQIA